MKILPCLLLCVSCRIHQNTVLENCSRSDTTTIQDTTSQVESVLKSVILDSWREIPFEGYVPDTSYYKFLDINYYNFLDTFYNVIHERRVSSKGVHTDYYTFDLGDNKITHDITIDNIKDPLNNIPWLNKYINYTMDSLSRGWNKYSSLKFNLAILTYSSVKYDNSECSAIRIVSWNQVWSRHIINGERRFEDRFDYFYSIDGELMQTHPKQFKSCVALHWNVWFRDWPTLYLY